MLNFAHFKSPRHYGNRPPSGGKLFGGLPIPMGGLATGHWSWDFLIARTAAVKLFIQPLPPMRPPTLGHRPAGSNRGHEWPKLGFEMSCLKIEQLYFQPEAECPQELYMCGLVFRISTAELKSVDPTVCKLIQHKAFEVRHQDT